MARLKAMEKKLNAHDSTSTATVTPTGRKRPAPTPKTATPKAKAKPGRGSDHEGEDEGSMDDGFPHESGSEPENPEDVTEAAKNNRLRRLCEKKPSGRCHVPDHVHEQWAKGGAERMALRDRLEEVGWDKDGVELIGKSTFRFMVVQHVLPCFTHFLGWSLHVFASQDEFLSVVVREKEKLNKVSRRKKRGWFTKEGMAVTLKWSKHLGRSAWCHDAC